MGAKLSCLLKGTDERQQIKDLLREYAAQSIGIEGKDFTFEKAYNTLRKEAGIEIDIESVAVLYMEEFSTEDAWFSSDEDIETRAGMVFEKTLSEVTKAQPFTETITIGERSPGSAAADAIMNFFADMANPNLGIPSTMRLFQDKMTKAAKAFINKDVNIDSRIAAIKKLLNELESSPTPTDPIEFQDWAKRTNELQNMLYNAETVDKNRILQEAEIAEKQKEVDALNESYKNNNDPIVKQELDKKRAEIRDLVKAKKEFSNIHPKKKVEDNFRMILNEAFLMDKRGYMNNDAPLAVLNSAKDVVEEFKREMAEYTAQALASGEQDPAWAAQIENYTERIINQTYDLLLSNKETTAVVRDALTRAGFSKDVKGKKTFDWSKLTDAANDTEYLKDQVTKALKDPELNGARPFTDNEIDIINNVLEREYNALKDDIIEKRLMELEKNNKVKLSPEKRSKAKQLVKLYNMGWFESDPSKYDKILNDIIGLSDIDIKTFNELERLGRALNELYRVSKESDQFIKSAVNNISDQIATLTDSYIADKDKAYKVARWFDGYMSYQMVTRLYTASNALIANNISGLMARYRNLINTRYFNSIKNTKGTKDKKGNLVNYYDATRQFENYMADIIRQDITKKGGLSYGDLTSTFVVRGNVDNYFNRLINENAGDAKTAEKIHLGLSWLNGRMLLNGQDSYFKYKITSTIFVRNMIRVVSSVRETEYIKSVEREFSAELKSETKSIRDAALLKVQERINTGKKARLEQHREDAIIEINQNLYGKVKNKDGVEENVWEVKLREAKEIIANANRAAGSRVVPDSDIDVARLAGDMLKLNLLNMKNIKKEHIMAAYNSSYKTAGYELGHVPNNFISRGVQNMNSYFAQRLEKAKKENIAEAWMWAAISTAYNKIINPFLGGGTNWVVNRYNGMGIGIIRSKFGSGATVDMIGDLTTDEGLSKLEQALWNENEKTSLFVQGAAGMIANITVLGIALSLFAAFGGEDDEENKEPFYSKIYGIIENNKQYKKFFRELNTGYLAYYVGLHNANLVSQKEGEGNAEFIGRFLTNAQRFVESLQDQTVVDVFSLEYERYTYQSIYSKMIELKKKGEIENAAGLKGELWGKTFGHPIPILRFIEQVKDTYNREADYGQSLSFMHGFFKSGAFNTFGNREANINPLVFWGGTPFYLGQPAYGLSSLPGIGPAAIKGLKDKNIDDINDLKKYIQSSPNGNIEESLRGLRGEDKNGNQIRLIDDQYIYMIEEIMHNNNKPVKQLSTMGFSEDQLSVLKKNKIYTVSQLWERTSDLSDMEGLNISKDQGEELIAKMKEYMQSLEK